MKTGPGRRPKFCTECRARRDKLSVYHSHKNIRAQAAQGLDPENNTPFKTSRKQTRMPESIPDPLTLPERERIWNDMRKSCL